MPIPEQQVILYYKINARIIGVGIVGPETGVTISKHLADLLMEKDGNWFLKKPKASKEDKIK